MWFILGCFLSICLAASAGLLVCMYLNLHRRAIEREEKLDRIFVAALTYQKLLDQAFEENNELRQSMWLDYLAALSRDALRVLDVYDDGSEEADIVRDMVYCSVTPEETVERLMKCRARYEVMSLCGD